MEKLYLKSLLALYTCSKLSLYTYNVYINDRNLFCFVLKPIIIDDELPTIRLMFQHISIIKNLPNVLFTSYMYKVIDNSPVLISEKDHLFDFYIKDHEYTISKYKKITVRLIF